MNDGTAFLSCLATDRDLLTADGPPSLTQLAAKVALIEAALVTLADTSPNRDASQQWLQIAGAKAKHNSLASHAIRAAARLLAERLREQACYGMAGRRSIRPV